MVLGSWFAPAGVIPTVTVTVQKLLPGIVVTISYKQQQQSKCVMSFLVLSLGLLRAECAVLGIGCDGGSLGAAGGGSGCCHDLYFHQGYVMVIQLRA